MAQRHWQPWQRAGTAATIAETSTPEWGQRMRRIKGARRAHETIRASGRIPGQEARARAAQNTALRQQKAQRERIYGPQWNERRNVLMDSEF